jgi:hypothetical protein
MNRISFSLVLVFLAGGAPAGLLAQGTAFQYQGQLIDGGVPANAAYDLRFAVYDAGVNGNLVGTAITNLDVPVSNGLFSVTLDFGANVFAGTNDWLDIAVRPAGGISFSELTPRQPVLPVPYAIFATGASNLLGTLPATKLSGALPSAQLGGTYSGAVNFNGVGNTFLGAFGGNGSGLTNLNATSLASGTVADVRLSANVPLLNGTQTYSGVNSFTNRANAFIGSFFGNGLVGWIPVSLTTTQAMPDAGYLLLNSGFSTVTLPASGSLLTGDIVRISDAGSGGWRALANTGQLIVGNFVGYGALTWLPANATAGFWGCLASSADAVKTYGGLNVNNAGIYFSTDAGHTWNSTAATGTGFNALTTSADGSKVFAAANGSFQFSLDSGGTWTGVAGFKSTNWVAVACSTDGGKVVAAPKTGVIYTSNNSGGNWSPSGSSHNWTAVAASATGASLYGTASGATLYSSINGGGWVGSATPANFTELVCSADGLKLAAAASPGGIYTSGNGGTNWTLTLAPSGNWSCLAASADCTRLVAGISNGFLYASADFGSTWRLINPNNQAWSALATSSDGTQVFAAANANAGNIYYSSALAQSTTSTNGSITGSQFGAVELQYLGNNQFMPVSSIGTLWAN